MQLHKGDKMQTQTKYKDEIIKQLQDVPDEDMPKFLEIIHYLKTGMKKSRKKRRLKKVKIHFLI